MRRSITKGALIGAIFAAMSLLSFLLYWNFFITPTTPVARELHEINLNLDDLNVEPTKVLTQTRDEPDQFKLIEYPIGEASHNFNVEFLGEASFLRSHGIEIRTEEKKICSVVLQFGDTGAREGYHEILGFLSVRERHHCYPYVWVPKWMDVTDMLNHFISAMQHLYPTELPDIGSEASWFHDDLNDFYYVVFYEDSYLVLVGETGSLENAIDYSKIIEGRIPSLK